MSWVEVDGDGWSWVEVDGAEWRWVHGLVILVFQGFMFEIKSTFYRR